MNQGSGHSKIIHSSSSALTLPHPTQSNTRAPITALFGKQTHSILVYSVSHSQVSDPFQRWKQHPGTTTTEHAAPSMAHGIMGNLKVVVGNFSLYYSQWRDITVLGLVDS